MAPHDTSKTETFFVGDHECRRDNCIVEINGKFWGLGCNSSPHRLCNLLNSLTEKISWWGYFSSLRRWSLNNTYIGCLSCVLIRCSMLHRDEVLAWSAEVGDGWEVHQDNYMLEGTVLETKVCHEFCGSRRW